jgi:hypothetical protein
MDDGESTKWLARAASAMACFSLLVVALDGYAAMRHPATDMGGVIARVMLFALAALELLPAAGFTALALWTRSQRGRRRRTRRVFGAITLGLAPISAFGAWIGISELVQWGF